ncbi:hypothetical protein I6N95_08415 [Vagococcus sp. BWB3-3]|uniref:DUF4767 domain-containing protein n=1 Tax=Vagococcus allomyrinae TaxID=2794353 RepID=A0A940SUP3_9ENTE|nr:hypothetical protein [Vagococcus allomyrinae]MBP1041024.1 hypothetical protein [Vagococcus allomyrinae]
MTIKKLILLIVSFLFLSACSQGSLRNELPPESSADLSKTSTLSQLVGEWASQTDEETYYLSIQSDSEKTIGYSQEAPTVKNKTYQPLAIESVTDEGVTALSQDEQTRYWFIFENEQITAYFGVNNDYYANKKASEIPVGLSKPIEYHKIID